MFLPTLSTPAQSPGASELSKEFARLDRPDRVRWQAAALLAYRRPPGADRLVAELGDGSWRSRGARLLARVWPRAGRKRSAVAI